MPTYTVEEFENRVKFYFKDLEETRNKFPDESGMINFIYQDIGKIYGDEVDFDEREEFKQLKTTPGYARIIRWAERRRTSYLERSMVENPRVAQGCMNALKQEKNGGYSDRPAEKKDKKLIVKLDMGDK